jgi:AraC-like DNA-binding protein
VESFVPCHALRDRVLSIECLQSQGHAARVLPSAGAVLGLQVVGRVVGPDGPLSAFGVTGIPEATREYAYEGPTETFLVRFRPQGAACLGLRAADLSGRSQSLEELLDAGGRARAGELLERVRAAPTKAARVALLEGFLLGLPFRRDQRLERAVERLGQGGGGDRSADVATVAREVGLSERQLERLFLERVGVSPKRYARLQRFGYARRLIEAGRSLDEVAYTSGYADQAHLTREFRAFSGTTPRRFSQTSDFVG